MFWWYEQDCGVQSRVGLLVRRLHESRSPLQRIEILQSELLGRVLALDGVIQTTTKDEFVYHEMISHVPLLCRDSAGEPCSVLIIGGGDGGTLREVLRHDFVKRVVMVEIDEQVVRVCEEHLGIQGDYADPRVQLLFKDGAVYLQDKDTPSFDVILVDSSDPLGGPSDVLFSDGFCASLRARLTPHGVVVRQLGLPAFEPDKLARGLAQMRAVFEGVQIYRAAVPSYYGGEMAFLLGSVDGTSAGRPRRAFTGRWYDPAMHQAAFVLPPAWGI